MTVLKTIITSLQGTSVLYPLIAALAGFRIPSLEERTVVDMVFFLLAILGFIRLFTVAGPTEDFECTS